MIMIFILANIPTRERVSIYTEVTSQKATEKEDYMGKVLEVQNQGEERILREIERGHWVACTQKEYEMYGSGVLV